MDVDLAHTQLADTEAVQIARGTQRHYYQDLNLGPIKVTAVTPTCKALFFTTQFSVLQWRLRVDEFSSGSYIDCEDFICIIFPVFFSRKLL